MPLDKLTGEHISPDDAIAKGLCPETGRDLSGINDIESHIKSLWPRGGSPEAERRIALLRAFDKKRATESAKETD